MAGAGGESIKGGDNRLNRTERKGVTPLVDTWRIDLETYLGLEVGYGM